MNDKKKNQSEDYRQEMEELARIFKEELDKAVEESENSAVVENVTDLQVEGYNPREVSTEDVEREYTPEELCECCGERPRGTEKHPDSPFCSECEAILEKYPYDLKGLVAFVATICITVASLICFVVNMPIFSYTFEGDKAHNDRNLLTASLKYDTAISLIDEDNEGKYLNVYEKRIFNSYELINMDAVTSDISNYFSDTLLKLPMFNTVKNIKYEIEGMQLSVTVIQEKLSAYETISDHNYDEVIATLDSLSGKKLYYGDTDSYEENEEVVIDKTKLDTVCSEAWINIYKYSAAQIAGKDENVIAEYLQKAADSSTYMEKFVNPLLAATYVGIGEYEKAEDLLDKIREHNRETSESYMIESMLYRYRDSDYQKGVSACLVGLNTLAKIPDGSDLIASYGYVLSMQKTLNYIMMKDYASAYESAYECYSYQSEIYSMSIQTRDLYAMLALETGDTEKFAELESEIEEMTALYGDDSAGFSEDVEAYKNGKVTLQELAMSGRYDLA